MDPATSRLLQDQLRRLYQLTTQIERQNAQKSQLKTELMSTLKRNGLQSKSFGVGNCLIRYKLDRSKDQISQKLLRQALQDYFQSDTRQAQALYQFILDQRQVREREVIDISRRKPA